MRERERRAEQSDEEPSRETRSRERDVMNIMNANLYSASVSNFYSLLSLNYSIVYTKSYVVCSPLKRMNNINC